MKKMTAIIMTAVLAIGLLSGCGALGLGKDDGPVSMYVGLGNTNSDYYAKLHEMILEGTGIDVKFVYNNTLDTSNAMINKLENDDAPADIIITAQSLPDELQEQAFLDMAAYTNLPDNFNTTKMRRVAVDGAIYQIPYCTRLIGVEYNKTLMDEYGWEVPQDLEEMKALKEKADEAGVTFAVSGGVAAGHGFNYFFHLMGSEFLSSAEGTQWFSEYLDGEAGIDEFAGKAEYFREYAEAGLFGTIHNEDWNAKESFAQERALFYYNIINDAVGEDFVSEDGTADEYLSMPWLSSNGSSNNFTEYDCAYFAIDKKLADQKEKLEEAVKVLDFMTSDQAIELFSGMSSDGYVSSKNFKIDDTRMYRDAAEEISKGYMQPWYYNYFDNDTIMNVGQKVNDYLLGTEGVEFEDILLTLDEENNKRLEGTIDIISNVKEELGYKDSARLQAASMGIAMQEAMDEAGVDGIVTVAILPYTESLDDLRLYKQLPVVQEKIYEGPIETSKIRSYIGTNYNNIQCIQMTGAQIRQLVKDGFNTLADYEHDHTFNYVCMIRGEGDNLKALDDDSLYYVAVAPDTLTKSDFDSLASSAVLAADGTPVTAHTENGLKSYFAAHTDISPANISW